mgnify:CR=1 FL=1|tara:strand:+ start:131 stop:607 length:477 start_codon:yes stop_codon:yes gene_type:complete
MKEISLREANILLKKLDLSEEELKLSIDPNVLVDLLLKSKTDNVDFPNIDKVSVDQNQLDILEVNLNNVCKVFGDIGKQMVYNGKVPGVIPKRDGSGKCNIQFSELRKHYPLVSLKHLFSGEQVYFRTKQWSQMTGKKVKTLSNKPSTTKVGGLRLYA